MSTNNSRTSNSILGMISGLFNRSRNSDERQNETRSAAELGSETNEEVTLRIGSDSPSSSATTESESSDDLVERLHDLRGMSTPQVRVNPVDNTVSTLHRGTQNTTPYPNSRSTFHRDLEFNTTNDSVGTDVNDHNATTSTNASGIWPSDPREYAPSALSSLWPPRGADSSSVSLDTEIANAISLSRARRAQTIAGSHMSSNLTLEDNEERDDSSHTEDDRASLTVISKKTTIMNQLSIHSAGGNGNISEFLGAPPPPPLPGASPSVTRRITRSQTQAKGAPASRMLFGSQPGPSTAKPSSSNQIRLKVTFAEDTDAQLPFSTTQSEAPSTIHPDSTLDHEVHSVNAYGNETTMQNETTVIPNPNFMPPTGNKNVVPIANSTFAQPKTGDAVRNMVAANPPVNNKRSSARVFNPQLEEDLYFYDLGNGNYKFLVPEDPKTTQAQATTHMQLQQEPAIPVQNAPSTVYSSMYAESITTTRADQHERISHSNEFTHNNIQSSAIGQVFTSTACPVPILHTSIPPNNSLTQRESELPQRNVTPVTEYNPYLLSPPTAPFWGIPNPTLLGHVTKTNQQHIPPERRQVFTSQPEDPPRANYISNGCPRAKRLHECVAPASHESHHHYQRAQPSPPLETFTDKTTQFLPPIPTGRRSNSDELLGQQLHAETIQGLHTQPPEIIHQGVNQNPPTSFPFDRVPIATAAKRPVSPYRQQLAYNPGYQQSPFYNRHTETAGAGVHQQPPPPHIPRLLTQNRGNETQTSYITVDAGPTTPPSVHWSIPSRIDHSHANGIRISRYEESPLERYQPLRLHIPSSEPRSNLLNERIYDGTLTAEESESVHNVFGNPTNHSIFNTSEGVDNPGVFESTSGGLQPAHIMTSSAPRKIDTGTSYSVPRTAPHANITMEMPKYSHELSKQGLRLLNC
jgi:hypothetical protein